MKVKYLFFVLSITLTASVMSCKTDKKESDSDQNNVQDYKENYGTGETSRTFQRINGKIEGKMTDYYPSGKLKGERFFVKDLQHGKTTIYYESGALKEVQYYDQGKKTGGDTIYYEDGTLKFVTEYKNDIKHGYLRKWDEAGGLIYEAKFAMDTLIEVGGKPVVQEKIAK